MSNHYSMPVHHPRVIGTRHMVASANYLAAQAAFEILEHGGNAIDAGVAGGIALSVLQCEFVNFAGVAPILVHLAATGETLTISGLGPWPKAASAAYFRENHGGRIPPGIKRTVVPAAPDAWITALERFGTMSFGDVASAAIRLGREGFAVQNIVPEIIGQYVDIFTQWPQNAAMYRPNGHLPVVGERFYQKDVAATLQYLADQELSAVRRGGRHVGLAAARDAFYRGDIATKIVAYHAENGGWLAADDLAQFRCDVESSLSITFGDVEVHACRPWCQGPVLLQALQLLDGQALKRLGHNSTAYIHTLIEALKLAFADREAYYGDPKFVNVPIDELLSSEYAARRRELIDPHRAWPEMPPAGDVGESTSAQRSALSRSESARPSLDTSFVCVVDREGNCFAATPSDDCLHGPIIPGTGLVPSCRGMQSWTDPEHPSCLAPGKRPRLTPSPALAIRKGRWYMPFGTPGADVQPQAMLQVLLNIFLFNMPPQEAIEQPRFATHSFPGSGDPHEYLPGRVTLERRFSDQTGAELEGLGHEVKWWRDWEWKAGAVCAVVADRETGMLEGGADVRRPGGVRGW